MLELHVQCRNRARVIDPSSALSSVFGSKWATFYINNREKVYIMIKTGTFEHWKLIIDNKVGHGGSHHLYVDCWPGEYRPRLKWDFFGGAPRGLIVKLRRSFFGL